MNSSRMETQVTVKGALIKFTNREREHKMGKKKPSRSRCLQLVVRRLLSLVSLDKISPTSLAVFP